MRKVAAALLLWLLLSMLPLSRADTTLGLPPVPVPPDNGLSAAKIALGKKLFFDKRLSVDGSTSCASCHHPEQFFSDGRVTAEGIKAKLGTRNTPSLLNSAFNTSQFWDGRRESFEAQAVDPFLNPREHGLPDEATLLKKIRLDATYFPLFQKAFPGAENAISVERVAQAISSYERTLISGNSPFDRYFYKGDWTALTVSAKNGLALFQGRAGCVRCHTIEKTHALFTDNEFHSLNIGLSRIESRLAELTKLLALSHERGTALDKTVLSSEDIAELGRFAVTYKPADIGKFRTPSLRNVAQTAPYMHNGKVATLEEAVEIELYYRSVEAARPLILTPIEKSDLVEFLKSLDSAVR